MSDKELIPAGRIVRYESLRGGVPSGKHHGHLCEVRKAEEVKEDPKDPENKRMKRLYELFDTTTNSVFSFEESPPRHKVSVLEAGKGNFPPRTLPALRAVVLMNRLGHRPKSVIIQTPNEVVVQVRGDFDRAVKRLKKVFKSKGTDEGSGAMRLHSWKLRGMGLMSVIERSGNSYMSVRFLWMPELGVRQKKPAEIEAEAEAAKAAEIVTLQHQQGVKVAEDDLESIDLTG